MRTMRPRSLDVTKCGGETGAVNICVCVRLEVAPIKFKLNIEAGCAGID
jgi:hypothetical protein